MSGFGYEGLRVRRREMRRKKSDGSEVQPSLLEAFEKNREPPAHPGALNALVGRILRKAKSLDAIVPHGRIAGLQVEPAEVDLGEMGEQAGGGFAILRDECGHFAHQNGVAKAGQVVGHAGPSAGA